MKNHYKLSPTQGIIPPEKTVGREKDLQKLEKALEAQSILIEEIRRTGKTLFLKKADNSSIFSNFCISSAEIACSILTGICLFVFFKNSTGIRRVRSNGFSLPSQ